MIGSNNRNIGVNSSSTTTTPTGRRRQEEDDTLPSSTPLATLNHQVQRTTFGSLVAPSRPSGVVAVASSESINTTKRKSQEETPKGQATSFSLQPPARPDLSREFSLESSNNSPTPLLNSSVIETSNTSILATTTSSVHDDCDDDDDDENAAVATSDTSSVASSSGGDSDDSSYQPRTSTQRNNRRIRKSQMPQSLTNLATVAMTSLEPQITKDMRLQQQQQQQQETKQDDRNVGNRNRRTRTRSPKPRKEGKGLSRPRSSSPVRSGSNNSSSSTSNAAPARKIRRSQLPDSLVMKEVMETTLEPQITIDNNNNMKVEAKKKLTTAAAALGGFTPINITNENQGRMKPHRRHNKGRRQNRQNNRRRRHQLALFALTKRGDDDDDDDDSSMESSSSSSWAAATKPNHNQRRSVSYSPPPSSSRKNEGRGGGRNSYDSDDSLSEARTTQCQNPNRCASQSPPRSRFIRKSQMPQSLINIDQLDWEGGGGGGGGGTMTSLEPQVSTAGPKPSQLENKQIQSRPQSPSPVREGQKHLERDSDNNNNNNSLHAAVLSQLRKDERKAAAAGEGRAQNNNNNRIPTEFQQPKSRVQSIPMKNERNVDNDGPVQKIRRSQFPESLRNMMAANAAVSREPGLSSNDDDDPMLSNPPSSLLPMYDESSFDPPFQSQPAANYPPSSSQGTKERTRGKAATEHDGGSDGVPYSYPGQHEKVKHRLNNRHVIPPPTSPPPPSAASASPPPTTTQDSAFDDIFQFRGAKGRNSSGNRQKKEAAKTRGSNGARSRSPKPGGGGANYRQKQMPTTSSSSPPSQTAPSSASSPSTPWDQLHQLQEALTENVMENDPYRVSERANATTASGGDVDAGGVSVNLPLHGKAAANMRRDQHAIQQQIYGRSTGDPENPDGKVRNSESAEVVGAFRVSDGGEVTRNQKASLPQIVGWLRGFNNNPDSRMPQMDTTNNTREHTNNSPKPRFSKKMAFFCLLAFVVVVAVAVAIPLALRGGDNSNNNNPDNDDETKAISSGNNITIAPSIAPTLSQRAMFFVGIVKSVSSESDLLNSNQPQFKAVDWLADVDEANLDPLSSPQEEVIQRYLIVLFAFSAEAPRLISISGDVCEWNDGRRTGIFCNAEGVVREISFREEQLQGSIPTEIFSLPALETFYVGGNSLVGKIPSEIGAATTLRNVDIATNSFTGSIPASIGRLTNIEILLLGSNTDLSGILPSSIFRMTNLKQFSIQQTNISGQISTDVSSLASLEIFDIVNTRIKSTIPTEIGGLRSLRFLQLGKTSLTGSMPSEIGMLSTLRSLRLDFTMLHSTIPTEIGRLTVLTSLRMEGSTSIIGQIPTEFIELERLKTLNVGNTGLNDINGVGVIDSLCEANQSQNQVLDFSVCGLEIVCSCCTGPCP